MSALLLVNKNFETDTITIFHLFKIRNKKSLVEGVMTAGIINMPSFLDRNGSHYLEKSLAPLWKLTYYSGLFFDWCAKIPHQSWKSVAAHYIVIAFGMTVYLQQLVLSCLQIMMAITNTESSLQRNIVPDVVKCILLLKALQGLNVAP